MARRCTQILTKKFGPSDEIEAIWILRDPFSYWPNMLLVRLRGLKGGIDAELSFEPSREGSDLPATVEEPDPVLESLFTEFPEVKGRCDLSSSRHIPGIFLHQARIQARHLLRRELAERGFQIPNGSRFFFTTYEEAGEIVEDVTEDALLEMAKQELGTLSSDQLFLARLATTCYAGVPERLTFLSWLEKIIS